VLFSTPPAERTAQAQAQAGRLYTVVTIHQAPYISAKAVYAFLLSFDDGMRLMQGS